MPQMITITAKAQKYLDEHGERSISDIYANEKGIYVEMYKPSLWKGVPSIEQVYIPNE